MANAGLRQKVDTKAGRRYSHLFGDRSPGFVGIEFCGRRCIFGRGVAKVLVEEDAVLVDDEGRDTRVAVLFRVSDEGETSGHLSVDDVIFRAALGIGSLFREHAIEVTVKWLLLNP
jgi:hypothetical protein